jgi:hypothetical protein
VQLRVIAQSAMHAPPRAYTRAFGWLGMHDRDSAGGAHKQPRGATNATACTRSYSRSAYIRLAPLLDPHPDFAMHGSRSSARAGPVNSAARSMYHVVAVIVSLPDQHAGGLGNKHRADSSTAS